MALPVSLASAKDHLGILDDDKDDQIAGYILDAAGWVESYTGHVLEPRLIEEQFGIFDQLALRFWPVEPESLAVTIEGVDGPVRDVENVILSANRRPARIVPPKAGAWPQLAAGEWIRAEYMAGWVSHSEIPRNLIRAMLVLIAAYDADREGGDMFKAAEETAIRLCHPFKRWTL